MLFPGGPQPCSFLPAQLFFILIFKSSMQCLHIRRRLLVSGGIWLGTWEPVSQIAHKSYDILKHRVKSQFFHMCIFPFCCFRIRLSTALTCVRVLYLYQITADLNVEIVLKTSLTLAQSSHAKVFICFMMCTKYASLSSMIK